MRKRILFIGPPLYGLLYPLISLAQAFRVIGHDVVISSAGKFANKAAEAGLVVFDAVPCLDSEAGYRHQEELRKKVILLVISLFLAMKWQITSSILQENGG